MKKILILIFILGFILRVYNLSNNVIFSYDQARDAQRIYDMVYGHHLKLSGPETDIPGVFNGPFFYYLVTPAYLLSGFNPNSVAIFLVILNLSGIFLLYYASLVLFKNKKIGLLAAFLWSISYEQANFSKYISNASLMSLTSIIFFLGLALYIFKKNKLGLAISVIGLALGIQFNIYLIYLGLFYFIYYFIFYPKIKVKEILLNILLFLLLSSPFILAEILRKFNATKSLLEYISNQTGGMSGIVESFTLYFQKLSETLYYSFFSFNNFIAFLLFILLIIFIYIKSTDKKSVIFILIWSLSTLPLFGFRSGVINAEVINSSIFGATTLIFSLGTYELLKNKRLFALGIIFILLVTLSNSILFFKDNFLNVSVLAKNPMFLSYEKEIIDYTYKKSDGKKFSICSVTEPLFINTLWSYLYNWYGNKKYGYLPFWAGAKQYLNKNYLSDDNNHVTERYLILENQGGIPESATKATLYLEDQISSIEDEKKFGNIVVQKRKFEKDKNHLKDTQSLSPSDIINLKRATTVDDRYSCYHN